MSPRIFARNLTARAATEVAGNPVVTRLEDTVGNCFPGLEFDHRNLDRRFFPGLVFEFADQGDTVSPQDVRRGARLLNIEFSDPDFGAALSDPATAELVGPLRDALNGDVGTALSTGTWFLHSIEQGGRTLSMRAPDDTGALLALDGMLVWRLVRSLEPGPATILLERRDTAAAVADFPTVTLAGWRRRFVDPRTGVIGPVFSPGELTQSMCSPWQHDFRDCSCFYWASNHPDIVLGEVELGESTLPSGDPTNPEVAQTPIDWLRSDRTPAASAAAGTRNRAFEMDHYEISQRWQELNVTLEGREIERIYEPRQTDFANPFNSADELADALVGLATLEHVLTLEYLYARYSLVDPSTPAARALPTLADDLVFTRHLILRTAVSEMRHLRWANQLLWELEHAGLVSKRHGPSLGVATTVPTGSNKSRPRALRSLTPATLRDFIAAEAPSGRLDGQYARVISTLRKPQYPPTLEQIAAQIIADGMEHFSRFTQIQLVLQEYGEGFGPCLRPIMLGSSADPDVGAAVAIYAAVVSDLATAYTTGDMEDARPIADARQKMFDLDAACEVLAARGVGVPFF